MTKKYSFTFITLMILGLSSCIKKDPIMRISQVVMVPLSPNASSVDFVINNQVFATSVGYSTTTGTATYTLPYYTVSPGTTTIQFNPTGQATPYSSTSQELEEDMAYTAFLIDSANKAKLAFVKDDVEAPNPGRVKIRFFHFSPNAPALDVSLGAAGAILFKNRSFNDQATTTSLQDYIEVDPGIVTFAFKTANTSTVLYTTSSINLLPDRIYTIAARGFVGGTGNQNLGGWVYANKSN